jgi:phosphoribosylaminoimidazolecarboxamide formyltransferase/IMP cyclohydrolase
MADQLVSPTKSLQIGKMKLALISVSNKSGLAWFGSELVSMGYTLIASGGTANSLAEIGLRVLEVSEFTGVSEMLDGRVKTLHPAIYGGKLQFLKIYFYD